MCEFMRKSSAISPQQPSYFWPIFRYFYAYFRIKIKQEVALDLVASVQK